jgi:hypothetical protein
MNTLQSIYRDIRQTLQHGTQSVKEKITSLFQHDTMTVGQVADFIQHHPSTTKTQQTYLGITYHFYHLRLDQLTCYMETKGEESEHILYATAFTDHKVLFTYRSYGQNASLAQTVHMQNLH